MILLVLTSVFGLVMAIISWYYWKSFKFWDKHGFPHTNPSMPWGDVQGMIRQKTVGEIVSNIYLSHSEKPFVGFWMLFKPCLLIRDPELIKSVFVRDFMAFHDRGISVNEKDDPLSAHLFSIAGSKWKNMRVKLTPTFTSGKMKMMFPILAECSKKFKKVLDEPAGRGEVIEIKEYAARFTTDVISLTAFGLDSDTLHNPNSEFRIYGRKFFEATFINSFRNIMQGFLPAIHKYFSMRTVSEDVSDFFLKVFKESMEYRETNKIRRNDFLDLLIQLKNKGRLDEADSDGRETTKFTFEETAAQAFVFFAAGFETSSTTIQFALYELAKNPDVQQKARDEINHVLGKHNGEVTYESVSDMHYLGRVVDETLRLYPPAPFLQRECNKDYKIPDTDLVLPKGTQVIIDCLGIQRDPHHYPNPEKFEPDRFTEEEKSKRHHYAYLPFGEGPRNCIGSRFGLMQSRVGLMTLLKHFKFSVASTTPIPLVFDKKSFVLSADGGMHLKLEKVQ